MSGLNRATRAYVVTFHFLRTFTCSKRSYFSTSNVTMSKNWCDRALAKACKQSKTVKPYSHLQLIDGEESTKSGRGAMVTTPCDGLTGDSETKACKQSKTVKPYSHLQLIDGEESTKSGRGAMVTTPCDGLTGDSETFPASVPSCCRKSDPSAEQIKKTALARWAGLRLVGGFEAGIETTDGRKITQLVV